MKITILSVTGSINTRDFPRQGALKVMQEVVGGMIEMVPNFNTYKGLPCEAYVNEEGRLLDLPLNKIATELWQQQLGDTSSSHLWRYIPEVFGTMIIIQGRAPA